MPHRNIEVTNLGNPKKMFQFSDAEELLAHLRSDKFVSRAAKKGIDMKDVTLTAITIREAAVDRTIALQAGICDFERTLGGLGGQPANFLDDRPIEGTGDYYYDDPGYVGLVCLEDTLVKIDEMGIEHGYDADRILWLDKQLERTVGQRLRSEAIINGRTLKEGHMEYARPGLAKLKEKLGEAPEQKFPE